MTNIPYLPSMTPDHIPADLLESYRSTIYTTTPPTAFSIKIGERNTQLDNYMQDNNLNTWAYITAENPRSQALSQAENNKRNEALRNQLHNFELRYLEGHGIPANSDWKPETSFLIFNISLTEAKNLAGQFDQNAFVHGAIDSKPTLICLAY